MRDNWPKDPGRNRKIKTRRQNWPWVAAAGLSLMACGSETPNPTPSENPSTAPPEQTPTATQSSSTTSTASPGEDTPTAQGHMTPSAMPTTTVPGETAAPTPTSASTTPGGTAPQETPTAAGAYTPTEAPSPADTAAETATPTPSPSDAPTVEETPTVDPAVRCAEGEPSILAQPLRRLSWAQYANTLAHIIETLESNPDSVEWYTGYMRETILRDTPPDALVGAPDEHRGGFRRLDQTLYQEHVEGWMSAGMWMAQSILTDWRINALVPGCSIRWQMENCLEPVLAAAGELTQRRPLDDEGLTFYADIYRASLENTTVPDDEDDPDGYRHKAALENTMAVMITAPYVTYHMEHGQGEDASAPPQAHLDAFELANRLSYHFWQGPPDAQLMAAAKDGSLLSDETYEQEVRRLFADPKSQRSLSTFYREWLRIDDLPEMNTLEGSPVWDSFRGDFMPTRQLNDDMIDEIETLAIYHSQESPTDFESLLLSNYHVSESQELSHIYGMQPWDGEGTPSIFHGSQRAGLLTRAAFLATGGVDTRPIMKGIWVWEALLCQDLGDPPDNAAAFPPAASTDLTTREVVELITEEPGSNCQGCHAYLINPYGFATENFDALGRHRSTQALYDTSGNITAQKPVNTADTSWIGWLPQDFENAGDLNQIMLNTNLTQRCFAQHYLRYTFSRPHDDTQDFCTLEDLSNRLIAGDSLDDVLLSIAFRPEFKMRSFLDTDGGAE